MSATYLQYGYMFFYDIIVIIVSIIYKSAIIKVIKIQFCFEPECPEQMYQGDAVILVAVCFLLRYVALPEYAFVWLSFLSAWLDYLEACPEPIIMLLIFFNNFKVFLFKKREPSLGCLLFLTHG